MNGKINLESAEIKDLLYSYEWPDVDYLYDDLLLEELDEELTDFYPEEVEDDADW